MAALEWILATLVAAWLSYLTYAATRGSARASLAAARQAMLATQSEVEHVGRGTPSLIVLHDQGGVVLRNQGSQAAVDIVCWIGRTAREMALEHLDPGQQSPLRAGPADVVLASCYDLDKRRYVAVYDPAADGARHHAVSVQDAWSLAGSAWGVSLFETITRLDAGAARPSETLGGLLRDFLEASAIHVVKASSLTPRSTRGPDVESLVTDAFCSHLAWRAEPKHPRPYEAGRLTWWRVTARSARQMYVWYVLLSHLGQPVPGVAIEPGNLASAFGERRGILRRALRAPVRSEDWPLPLTLRFAARCTYGRGSWYLGRAADTADRPGHWIVRYHEPRADVSELPPQWWVFDRGRLCVVAQNSAGGRITSHRVNVAWSALRRSMPGRTGPRQDLTGFAWPLDERGDAFEVFLQHWSPAQVAPTVRFANAVELLRPHPEGPVELVRSASPFWDSP